MASNGESNNPSSSSSPSEEEGKIPVLTVLKNNAVLKNIFIVNKPPEEEEQQHHHHHHHRRRDDHEDILLVGRHPDCDLMLTHPSISRFHLQIRSKPSSLSLTVVDLSSVHGTWVSGRKIEAGVSVEMKEGDTLRIGVSSRVYRLHWIPISHAYDLENPFVPQQLLQEREEEEEEEEEMAQKLNSCPVKTDEETQSVDSVLECISSLFLDENVELTVEEKIPAAALQMLDNIVSSCREEKRKSPSKDETFGGVPSDPFATETSYSVSDGEKELCDSLNQVLSSPPCVESVGECENTLSENLSETESLPFVQTVLGTKMQLQSPHGTFSSPLPPCMQNSFEKQCSILLMNIGPASFDEKSTAEAVISKESDSGCTVRDNGRRVTDVSSAGAGIFNSENMFFPCEEVIPGTEFPQMKVVEEVAMDSLSDGNKSTARNCPIPLQIESVDSSMPQEDVSNQALKPDREILESREEEAVEKNSTIRNIWSRRGKDASAPQIRTSKSVLKSKANDNEVAMSNENDIITKAISKDLLSVLDGEEEEEIFTPDKENFSPNTLQLRFLKKKGKQEEIKHSMSQRSHNSKNKNDITNKTISKDLFSVLDGKEEDDDDDEIYTPDNDNEVAMSNENDIITKAISKDLLSVLDGEEEEEIFTPDKENFSPNTLQLRFLKKKGKQEEIKHSMSQRSHNSKNKNDITNKTISKDLFSVLDGKEEDDDDDEIYTPDKENFSPNTLQLQLLKKNGKLEEIKCSKSQWSRNFGPNIYLDERMSPTSSKENQIPKGSQDQKLQRKPFGSSNVKLVQEEQDIMALKNRVERVPFQSLKSIGGKGGRPGTSCLVSAPKSIDVSKCRQILDMHINPSDISCVQKRSWDMVVDTNTLTNKESRKALQLLQGLKGTQLIIPRLVIRELQRMKQQLTIFRGISEASLALEWIEECMVKTNRWIHIQSSVEEGGSIAPTPPASPQTQFGEESLTFLSSHKCSMEIDSPTVEDHILDFALLYKRRQQYDGQLVLLSEDVTLKIKCMAEGLLCEPVQEFRESLVNPFSGRFLWTNSSPRGQTWSCQDDVVLREKYCPLPLKKSSKGVASGLKLILLHNSQYRH